MTNITFPFNGILDTIFRQTDIAVQVVGVPNPPYRITLIGLILILILSIAAMAITERLTGKKPGGIGAGIAFTLIGSIVAVTFIRLPFDFAIEGVRVIAALLGAVVIATFYVLIKAQMGGGKK